MTNCVTTASRFSFDLEPFSLVDEDLTFIYEDKEEAMKMLKTFKDARFKKFIIETDAINFSRNGMNGNGNASFNSSDRKGNSYLQNITRNSFD